MIYFVSLDYFGIAAYIICILIIGYMWILQIVNYQLAEAAPELVTHNKSAEETMPETTEKDKEVTDSSIPTSA
jgi:hypothetical protein